MGKYTNIKQTLKNDNGFAVYNHYGFTPSNQVQKENPFRNEKTISFYIKPQGYFLDFGDIEIKGDAFKFIQLYEKCDFKQACKIASHIYGLDTLSDYKATKPALKANARQLKENIRGELESIAFREASQSELDYWQDKTGIASAKELTALGVLCVQSFSIRYAKNVIPYVNQSFCFAFEIVKGKSYKLYQPKAHLRGYGKKAKTTILPNLDSAKEIDSDFEYSIGIDSLDNSKTAFLVGGESDYLALKAKGLNVFTVGSEKGELNPYTLARLEAKGIENIATCFDTDCQGIQSAKKLQENHKFGIIELPKLERQTDKNQPKPVDNDICDYLKLYGFDVDLQKAFQNPSFQSANLDQLKQDNQGIQGNPNKLPNHSTIKIEKYVGEQINFLASLASSTEKQIGLNANTGTGKTDAMYQLANLNFKRKKKLFRKLICVYPTNSILDSKTNEYSKKENNYNGLEFGILDINQYTPKEILQRLDIAFQDSNVVHITRNSFHKIASLISKNDLVVCDEIHKIISDGFENLGEFWEQLQKTDAKKWYLTGTPINHFYDTFNIKSITFQESEPKQYNFNFYELTKDGKEALSIEDAYKTYKQGILNYVSNLDTSQNLVYPIFHNSKKALDFLEKEIEKTGVFDVVKIYSSEKIRQGKAYKSIIEKGIIPTGKKPVILLATSYLYEGISIQNSNIGQIAFFGESVKENLLQAVARFRKVARQDVNIFLNPQRSEFSGQKVGSFESYQKFHFGQYSEVFSKIQSSLASFTPSKDANPLQEIRTRFAVDKSNYITSDLQYSKFNLVSSYYEKQNQLQSNYSLYESLNINRNSKKSWLGIVNISMDHVTEIEKHTQKEKEKRQEIEIASFELCKQNLQFVYLFLSTQKQVPTKLKEKLRAMALDRTELTSEPYKEFEGTITDGIRTELISIVSKLLYLENFFVIDLALIDLLQQNYTVRKWQRLCEKITLLHRNSNRSELGGLEMKINKLYLDKIQDIGLQARELKLTKQEILKLLRTAYGKSKRLSDSKLFSIFKDMFEFGRAKHRTLDNDLEKYQNLFYSNGISLEQKLVLLKGANTYIIESIATPQTFASAHNLSLNGLDIDRNRKFEGITDRQANCQIQEPKPSKSTFSPQKEFEKEMGKGWELMPLKDVPF